MYLEYTSVVVMSKLDVLCKLGVGRRQPSDPFFAEGDAVCRAYKREGIVEVDDEDLCHEVIAKFPCSVFGCMLEFDSLLQYEMHYNSSHRYICSECRKRLPSPHLLDLHISETHDSFFLAQTQRNPMYRCYVEDCDSRFATPQDRHSHCIEDHQFPHDFRFDNARKHKTKHCKSKLPKGGIVESAMEVDTNPGDSKCVTSVNRPKSKPETVAVLPQTFEESDYGNGEKCKQKYERRSVLGEPTCTTQVGRGVRTEGFGKPFSFVRGRGKCHRLGGMSMKFKLGTNEQEHSSSSNSNMWNTSGLLDALEDTKGSSDREKYAEMSNALDVKNECD